MTKPTTLIVGCGFLGRRAAQRLVRRRERVFGTARTAGRAAELETLGVEPVVADVLDPTSVAKLPAADRVLYCVGFDRASGVPMRAIYVDGLRYALEALSGRYRRWVYASSTSVYARTDGNWVDEDEPAEPTTEAGRVVRDAERVVEELAGAEHVIVRFSGLYGPGRVVRREALERGEPVAGEPTSWLNLIHVEDAAAAAVGALDWGRAGRVYHATDDRPVARREYYHLAAALLGAPAPRFVPAETAGEPNKRVSNGRIKAELGFAPAFPDVTRGLPAVLAEERRRAAGG